MRLLFWFCCLVCIPLVLPGQNGAAALERRPVSEQQWKDAAQDLDYSADVPEKTPQEEATELPDDAAGRAKKDFQGLGSKLWATIFQTLLIVLAVAAIGYAVYRLLQAPRNKRIARDGTEITAENLENYLPETDLERFLQEALATGKYTLAIRIQYLKIIKNLSEAGAIHWSMEKTNRDYLREMHDHPQAGIFRELTLTYERIWYGNADLNAETYAGLAEAFLALNVNLQTSDA